MFEIREGDVPVLQTQQALLCLDLQNDLHSTGCILPVDKPAGWVGNICTLAPIFRSMGKLIWIRSQFDSHRPINDGNTNSEYVITDNELSGDFVKDEDVVKGSRPKPSKRLMELYDKILAKNGGTSDLIAGEEGEEDDEEDEPYDNETFLTIEEGKRPECLLPLQVGSNFIQAVVPSMDAEKDIYFTKTHYSAFKSGHLLQILRGQFVTELFICGALTNISIFATAMDAARYGYSITLVEDCLGYRSKARHDEAIKQVVEATGCEVISSAEFFERRNPKPNAQRKSRRRKQERAVRDDQSVEELLNGLKLADRSELGALVGGSTKPKLKPHATTEYGDFDSDAKEISRDNLLSVSNESLPHDSLPKKPAGLQARVPTKIKTRRRRSKPALSDLELKASKASGSSKDQPLSPTKERLAAASAALAKMSLTSSSDSVAVADDAEALQPLNSSAALEVGSSENESSSSEDLLANARQLLLDRKFGKRPIPRALVKKPESEVPAVSPLPLEVNETLCEGDTAIITNVLSDADLIFERVRDEVRWQKMSHQGGEVPRLVAVQGELLEDGSIPVYRHPADESPPLLLFSSTVSAIKKEVEKCLGHKLNHCLIQFYRGGTDYISEHSDKTLDIVPNTFIANVSLGAMRTMTFRTKKPPKTDETYGKEDSSVRQSCKAPLPHNSLCRMGLKTNMKWLHSIRQDKRALREKTPDELAYGGARISLTFRYIGTYLSKDQTKIWGQGAIAKTKEEARSVLNGETPESEAMIKAFGLENHSSDFDWPAAYGGGFDVLHISNARKLFLSGDPLTDLRVKILLAEYRIKWTIGKLSPSFNWKNGSLSDTALEVPEKFPIRLVDNDLARSVVETELSILIYLETLYGPKRQFSQATLALQFSRFGLVRDLCDEWCQVKAPLDRNDNGERAFKKKLLIWDGYVKEDAFMAGSVFTLTDTTFFPVLRDVILTWGGLGDEYSGLKDYYELLRLRSSVMEALGDGDGSGWEEETNEK